MESFALMKVFITKQSPSNDVLNFSPFISLFVVSRRNFPQRRSHSSEASRQLLLNFISSDNNSPRENFIQFSPTSIYLVTERRTTKCFFYLFFRRSVKTEKNFPDNLTAHAIERRQKLNRIFEGKLKETQWGQMIVPKMSELLSHCVLCCCLKSFRRNAPD